MIGKKFSKVSKDLTKYGKGVLIKAISLLLVVFVLGFIVGISFSSCSPAQAEEIDSYVLDSHFETDRLNVPITFQVDGNESTYGEWFPYVTDTPFVCSLDMSFVRRGSQMTFVMSSRAMTRNTYVPSIGGLYSGYTDYFTNSAVVFPSSSVKLVEYSFSGAFTKAIKRDWAFTVERGLNNPVAWNWFYIGATDNFGGEIVTLQYGNSAYERGNFVKDLFTETELAKFNTFYNWSYFRFVSSNGGYFYVVFETCSVYLSDYKSFILSGAPMFVELDQGEVFYEDGYNVGWNTGYNTGYQSALDASGKQIYDQGYFLGSQDGYTDGYGDGYDVGESNGYNNGYDVGYDVGFSAGESNGYDLGYDDGYSVGVDQSFLNTSLSPAYWVTSAFDALSAVEFGGFKLVNILLVAFVLSLVYFLIRIFT